MNPPLISICLIAYNHVKYIREAIESIINQKVTFSWELIIADDFSLDGTREIILEYKDKYPTKIITILQGSNIGAAKNWIDLISYPSSKYIAYIEGDDYWLDLNKLQRQVDFLEINKEFSMCFTNSVIINTEGQVLNHRAVEDEFAKHLSHEEILSNSYFITSASAIYRRNAIPTPLPEIFNKVINGDYLLYAFITKMGPAAYLDFNSSAYRVHQGGIWTKGSELTRYWAMFKTFKIVNRVFKESSEKEALKKNLKKILQNLSWTYAELPKRYFLYFLGKSLMISLKYGVFKTWILLSKGLLK